MNFKLCEKNGNREIKQISEFTVNNSELNIRINPLNDST